MARVNAFTDGAFSKIIGNDKEISLFDKFLNTNRVLDSHSPKLKKLLGKYKSIINNNKPTFEQLAILETLIMQMNMLESFTNDMIKLNLVREYVYARIPFQRVDIENKDVRVIVGTTADWGVDNIDKLYKDNEFMEYTRKKLVEAMNDIIKQTETQLKQYK